jgi:Protein of unknown function (DUF3152)
VVSPPTHRDERPVEPAPSEWDDVSYARRGLGRVATPRPQRGIRGFVHRYGWRAYALPVLIVITVAALLTSGRSSHPASAANGPGSGPTGAAAASTGSGPPTGTAPSTAASDGQLKVDQPGAGALNQTLAPDALPTGGPYTMQGTGNFSIIPGTTAVVGSGTVHRYSIDVEGGVTGVDLKAFTSTVTTVLSDPKSWAGHNGVALQRVDSGPVEFHITLTSALTVRKLCGYEIQIETSCWDPGIDRVVLNVSRWVRGDAAYIGDLAAYRIYMVNHEDGHALGHQHAHQCLADGLAPAMMQQTIGLKSTTGQICQANPWPYPTGARDAPGAEAPDTNANNESTLQTE